MTANLSAILGVEAMCAAQGIEQRAPLTTSAPLQKGHGPPARQSVPSLHQDRYLAPDLSAAATCIAGDSLARAAGLELTL
jgi:histidine ammonia-lyase